MAMRLYAHNESDGHTTYIVHLDEDRGRPDDVGGEGSDWTVEYRFPPYDVGDPPLTGAKDAHDPADGEPPMRAMTEQEVRDQQRAEVVALAREERAARLAREDQSRAGTFARGGESIG